MRAAILRRYVLLFQVHLIVKSFRDSLSVRGQEELEMTGTVRHAAGVVDGVFPLKSVTVVDCQRVFDPKCHFRWQELQDHPGNCFPQSITAYQVELLQKLVLIAEVEMGRFRNGSSRMATIRN